MSIWIVMLRVGDGVAYGPFPNKEAAYGFAAYLTAEVDPATVHEVRSPVDELLGWYAHSKAEVGP